jgi:hypothetical protein
MVIDSAHSDTQLDWLRTTSPRDAEGESVIVTSSLTDLLEIGKDVSTKHLMISPLFAGKYVVLVNWRRL